MSTTTASDSRWLHALLSAIVALLAVIAIELSALVSPALPRAYAGLPDSAKQRIELIELGQETNANIVRILHLLQTQPIKVKVVSADKDSKDAKRATSRRSPQAE